MDYFFSVRGRDGDAYSNKAGATKYLAVPGNRTRVSRDCEISRARFFADVQAAAGADDTEKGHVVFFVHGFNTEQMALTPSNMTCWNATAKSALG